MDKLLVGIIFVFFDFSITIGNADIGLIPDFIGYLLILKGIDEMSRFSERFVKVKLVSKIMFAYSLVVYVANLLNFIFYSYTSYTIVIVVLAFISKICSLYIAYRINICIKDIQNTTGKYLYADELIKALATVIVFNLLLLLTIVIHFLFTIGVIVSIFVNAYYIFVFYRTRSAFYTSFGECKNKKFKKVNN